jgi:hypothetical protein
MVSAMVLTTVPTGGATDFDPSCARLGATREEGADRDVAGGEHNPPKRSESHDDRAIFGEPKQSPLMVLLGACRGAMGCKRTVAVFGDLDPRRDQARGLERVGTRVVSASRQVGGTMRRAIGLSVVLMVGCVTGAVAAYSRRRPSQGLVALLKDPKHVWQAVAWSNFSHGGGREASYLQGNVRR